MNWEFERHALAALKARLPAEQRRITETSRRELLAAGITPPAVSVAQDRTVGAEDAVVIGRVVWPGRPLIAPDNARGPCDGGCGRAIQARPHIATMGARILCVWCITKLLEDRGQIERLTP